MWEISKDCLYIFSDCPCEINCPNGCNECPNPICDRQEMAVLMLNTGQIRREVELDYIALVVGFDGKFLSVLYYKALSLSKVSCKKPPWSI